MQEREEQKTEQIIVKLTPSEKGVLRKEADHAGLSMSAFLLLCMKSYTDGVRFEKKEGRNRDERKSNDGN